MHANITGTKTAVAGRSGTLKRFVATPKTTASAMKSSDAVATSGERTNVSATWRVNSAQTRTSVLQQKSRKRSLPGRPRTVSITDAIERPSWRTESQSETMSWTAPMKMQPSTTHATTAPQPK